MDTRRRRRPDRVGTGFSASRRGQSGVALLVVLVLAGVIAIVTVLNLIRDPAALDLAREQATQAALARAKQALIHYAIAKIDEDPADNLAEIPVGGVPSFPGLLPCPDVAPPPVDPDDPMRNSNEGLADVTLCGAAYVSVVGRLPWRTIGSEPIRDGHGECLWYMVSGRHKGGPGIASIMFNWDSPGQLLVHGPNGQPVIAGNDPGNQAVAVIIAPGPALEGASAQDRSPARRNLVCPGNYDPTNYLEGAVGMNNAAPAPAPDVPTLLISGYVDPVSRAELVNDRVGYITPHDIFREMTDGERSRIVGTRTAEGVLRRLTRKVAECVAQFTQQQHVNLTDRRIAFAGRLSLPLTGGAEDAFRYRDAARYVDHASTDPPPNEGRLRGRVPFRVDNTKAHLDATPRPAPPGGGTMNPPNYGRTDAGLLTQCSHWSDPPGTDLPGFAHWYRNWKDHLFLAVAPAFGPMAESGEGTSCLGPGGCLTVGTTTNVAAVVFFAGYRRAPAGGHTQTRWTAPDREEFANYLEGINVERFANPASGNDFISADASPALTNDVAYCLVSSGPGAVPTVEPC